MTFSPRASKVMMIHRHPYLGCHKRLSFAPGFVTETFGQSWQNLCKLLVACRGRVDGWSTFRPFLSRDTLGHPYQYLVAAPLGAKTGLNFNKFDNFSHYLTEP